MTFTDVAACSVCGAHLSTPDDWWPDRPKPMFRTCLHFKAPVVPLQPRQGELPFAGGVPLTTEDYTKSVKSAKARQGRLFP